MTIERPPLPLNPFDAFAIGRGPDPRMPTMTQRLGAGLTDHRGVIELPALTVLFDDIAGLPFFHADLTKPSMQSRLSIAMAERPAVDDILTATAQLLTSDDSYGTTGVTITGNDDRTLCVGHARNVRVGRSVDGDMVAGGLEIPLPDNPPSGITPEPIDRALTGPAVITALVDQTAPIGPLAELLAARITAVSDTSVTTSFTSHKWMANLMGSMHGGVIAAMLSQAISFGAQLHVNSGNDYRIIDFTCEFLRSPEVDGHTMVIDAAPAKLGRRLSTFDALMHDGDRLIARATADVIQFASAGTR